MSQEPDRRKRLTDLEMTVLRALRLRHQQHWRAWRVNDEYLQDMARMAVEVLTVGSASGRRREAKEARRYPDPGCTPDNIRRLARQIEASYHSMPNGWVTADELREHPDE